MKDAVVPYPGLRPFEEKDRAIFFGREAQMVSVLALLEEQQFVAVVGSSGSGKSSLILAGVIPAVREGFLRGTREWKIIVLKPGSDPCGNLARALEQKGLAHEHAIPTTVTSDRVAASAAFAVLQPAAEGSQTLVEKLHAADRSLIDLVTPPSASSSMTRTGSEDRGELSRSAAATFAPPERLSGPRVLIVVDQFEELFTFRRVEGEAGSKSARFASRDEAATFVRLLLRACAEPDGRIAIIITMRSDFIGDCDAFLDLPELVSRCQFLVPRLNRSQMREAIERPGQVEDLGYAPFTFEEGLVNRIIADAGDRLDQLPLMQHALMRTWKLAGGPETRVESPLTLTHDHYRSAGRIAEALSKHADAAWTAIEKDAAKSSLTRRLFLLLSDVHPDGKIVRRRPLLSEVQAITGADLPAIEEVVRCFQADDRNFLLPLLKPDEHLTDTDHLDISHEALLRQWKEFSKWLAQEAEWKVWLQELSQAAKDYEKCPEGTDLWQGNDLHGAEAWMREAQPSDAWAKRHSVANWPQCLHFLDRSRRHRQMKLLLAVGLLVLAFIIGAAVVVPYRQTAKRNAQLAEKNANDALVASGKRLEVIKAFAATADKFIGPIVAYGKSSFSEVEKQGNRLTNSIRNASNVQAPPPDQAVIDDFARAREAANGAASAIEELKASIENAAGITGDEKLLHAAEQLAVEELEVRGRRQSLRERRLFPDAASAIQTAIEARLAETEKVLAGMLGKESLDAALVMERDKDILGATAYITAIDTIRSAAVALGFEGDNYVQDDDAYRIGHRLAKIGDTLAAARKTKEAAPTTAQIPRWKPEPPWKPENGFPPLAHGGRVNRVQFAPNFPADAPLLVAACEDREVYFWQKDGTLRGVVAGTNAVNDVAFSPQGDAIAAASNGSTVRLLRWPSAATLETFKRANIKVFAFERHSDSINDVEFSHGGDRVASASADRTVRVFDSRSIAQLYFTSPPLPGIVTSVAFHRGDNLVVSGCDDGGVRLHTIDQPAVQLLWKFDAPARRPEFSYDGKLVIAASGDRTARVWPIVQPREIVRIPHDAPVTQATFRPVIDAQNYPFITTATNGEVRLVRLSDITLISANYPAKVLEPRHPGAAVSATWSAGGRWLATVGGGEVILWEWVADAPVARLRIVDLHAATSRAEFSLDARLLVTYGGDHLAYVWDLTKLPATAP